MKVSPIVLLLASFCLTSTLSAQTIENPGFEDEWDGWDDIDPDKDATAISEDSHSGDRSAKITGETGRFEQAVEVSPQSEYELKAFVRGDGIIGLDISGETFTSKVEGEGEKWVPVSLPFSTETAEQAVIFGAYIDDDVRFDDFELIKLRSKAEELVVGDGQNSQVLEDPVIRILGSDLSSDVSEILLDVADVTSEGADIRVLSIIGDGSVNNLNDLLYLRGIDAAMVQSDVLSNFRERSAVRNLEQKLVYVAQLGTTVGHLLAQKSSATIYDLAGKKVYIGEPSSSSFVSASNILKELDINADVVGNLNYPQALADLKAGVLDAVFWMEIPPVGLLSLVRPEDNLHLLHIPTQGIDSTVYNIRELTANDYNIISDEGPIQTATAKIALIAYDWPRDHPRYAKMKRFSEILKTKEGLLREDGYHRSFRGVEFYSDIEKSWRLFE